MDNAIKSGTRVRFARGRKVAIGTEGQVFWLGSTKFRGVSQERAGVRLTSGEKVFTALSNLERLDASAPEPAFAPSPVVEPRKPVVGADAEYAAFVRELRAVYGVDAVRVALEASADR